jgi:hypothetical protein
MDGWYCRRFPIDRIDAFDQPDLRLSVCGKPNVTALVRISVKFYGAKVAKRASTVGKWL